MTKKEDILKKIYKKNLLTEAEDVFADAADVAEEQPLDMNQPQPEPEAEQDPNVKTPNVGEKYLPLEELKTLLGKISDHNLVRIAKARYSN